MIALGCMREDYGGNGRRLMAVQEMDTRDPLEIEAELVARARWVRNYARRQLKLRPTGQF